VGGDSKRVVDRINKIRMTVKDGWCDGDGLAPTPIALDNSEWYIIRLQESSRIILDPHIFPTIPGGINAEFVIGTSSIDINFDPDGKTIEMYGTNNKDFDKLIQIDDEFKVVKEMLDFIDLVVCSEENE
jgi:hypothetical protein